MVLLFRHDLRSIGAFLCCLTVDSCFAGCYVCYEAIRYSYRTQKMEGETDEDM